MSFYKDNEDLQFYVERAIEWDRLIELTERRFVDPEGPSDVAEARALYRDVMSLVGELAANEIASRSATIDAQGVHLGADGEVVFPKELDRIMKTIADLELHGLTVPRELGGMNAPMLVYFLNSEMLGRADVSVMAHHGFHGGMAMALLLFSLREGTTTIDPETGRVLETRFRDAIGEIVRGEAWGCMDITEPDAGSDMAALRAVGEQDADGRWTVTGEKIFITSGHGKWHFVIARTEPAGSSDDPMAGLKGLSFFLVKAYEDRPDGTRERYVKLSRVEEKMGHHGSATCGLVFERAPAELLGQRGEGFRYMLTLMNNARIGVGFECLGLCEAAYRKARDYAAERRSMGKTIDRHEMIADMLDEMEADVVALRAMAVMACWHEEFAHKLQLAIDHYGGLSGEEREAAQRELKRHQRKARRITPLLKYFGAEKAVEMSRRCVQIHGGNGYIVEYGAEKLLRDAMVMPIYEGTSQIQSLMAMKDTLQGILKNPRRFVRQTTQARWRALSARDPLDRRVAKLQSLSFGVQRHLVLRTAGDKAKGLGGKPMTEWPSAFLENWDPKRDFAFAMLHAERLTKILTDVVIAELLLEQATRFPERRPHLERHLERAELRCAALEREILESGERLLRKLGRLDPHAEAAE
ncbi:MAG: acyl-CoA dehydrogenase family protein [Myxococcales bacterium]|nr:acyl-CoA dehydrogenase family protein [Myxococcales bacterium]